MNKKLAAVAMAGLMALSLTACGNKGPVQKAEIPKVTMTIQVKNGLKVDITDVAVSSDVRVDPDQQINKPENLGVSGLLPDDTRIKPNDSIEIQLTVDDPEYFSKQQAPAEGENAESTDTTEEGTTGFDGADEDAPADKTQKFVISVTDINGNVFDYKGVELTDNSVYVVKDGKVDVQVNGVSGNFADSLKVKADEAQSLADTKKTELDAASSAADAAMKEAYYKKDKKGEFIMDGEDFVKIDEADLDADKVAAYEEAKAAHENAVAEYDQAKLDADNAKAAYDLAVKEVEAGSDIDTIKEKIDQLNG